MSVIITTIITLNFIHRMATLTTGISFPIGVALTSAGVALKSIYAGLKIFDSEAKKNDRYHRGSYWTPSKEQSPKTLKTKTSRTRSPSSNTQGGKTLRTATYENLDNRCHYKVSNEQPGIVLIAFAKISVGNLASSRFFTFPVSL